MTKRTKWILLGVLVVVALYLVGFYNGAVTRNREVDTRWAQVEAQYQRRVDLVPNLVASVRAALNQEQEVFGDLAEARTRYVNASSVEERVGAAREIEGGLSRLFALFEQYPNLRSVEAIQTLMAQLEGTENRIAVERQRYNEGVRDYNLHIERFPGNALASIFGFTSRTFFEAQAGAEQAPKVDL